MFDVLHCEIDAMWVLVPTQEYNEEVRVLPSRQLEILTLIVRVKTHILQFNHCLHLAHIELNLR